MAYSPVCKSKNKKSDNESLLEDIRSSIDKEYREAVQSDDWSNYEFVYKMYCNYKLNGGNSEYVKSIVKRYQSQYTIKGIERIQRDFISRTINIALNDTKEVETVSTEAPREKFIDFNERVYDTYMSPMIKAIEGTELDCHNIVETKHETFEEMSYEEKIKFVNKEIDDVLDFIERNKQVEYNKWKDEFYNGTRLR